MSAPSAKLESGDDERIMRQLREAAKKLDDEHTLKLMRRLIGESSINRIDENMAHFTLALGVAALAAILIMLIVMAALLSQLVDAQTRA
jgi:hypothetical protein